MDTTHSFIANLIGQARNYKAAKRWQDKMEAAGKKLHPYYLPICAKDVYGMLLANGYFSREEAGEFAEAYIALLETSTPTRKKK